MTGSLRLRVLEIADLPFADSLRALAGWNQTLLDWERFIAFSPQGCFLAEWNRRPAGVVTTICYGRDLGWIGMVLVHPDYRRQGIGCALLKRAVAYLHHLGVPSIKLDATPEGQPSYRKLGFQEERTLSRWQGVAALSACAQLERCDLSNVQELDTASFGTARRLLLKSLMAQRAIAQSCGRDGYGILRGGARAFYLGPVIARSPKLGIEIVSELLSQIPGELVFWDVFDGNIEIAKWAREHGFKPQRKLTRMVLGEEAASGIPEQQIAIAGPELG